MRPEDAKLIDIIRDNLDCGRSADYGIAHADGVGDALRMVYADHGDDISDVELAAMRAAADRAGVTLNDI